MYFIMCRGEKERERERGGRKDREQSDMSCCVRHRAQLFRSFSSFEIYASDITVVYTRFMSDEFPSKEI